MEAAFKQQRELVEKEQAEKQERVDMLARGEHLHIYLSIMAYVRVWACSYRSRQQAENEECVE